MKFLSTVVFFFVLAMSSAHAEIRFPSNLALASDVKNLAIEVITTQCSYALESNVTLRSVDVQKIEVDQGITDYRFKLSFSVVNGNDYETLSMVIFKFDISNPDINAVELESLYNNTGLCN